MKQIKCTVFRKSGKYYTDEIVYIPDETTEYDIPHQIFKNRKIPAMIYVGKTLGLEIPFLVPSL